MSRLLLCTDLDRTLLPNGSAPEPPGARERFARLVAAPEVVLVYATGRDRELVDQAMVTWNLPRPDLLVGDVGTTIVAWQPGQGWTPWGGWERVMAAGWEGRQAADLAVHLGGLPDLVRQDERRQGPFKLSYFTPPGVAGRSLADRVGDRLTTAGVPVQVVWSQDETRDQGLLDLLPPAAGKLGAIGQVMKELAIPATQVLCAGDSDNDMDMLTSPLPAVLVGNATDQVRDQARRLVAEAGRPGSLHCAEANYAAGIIEGVLHFHPHLATCLEEEA